MTRKPIERFRVRRPVQDSPDAPWTSGTSSVEESISAVVEPSVNDQNSGTDSPKEVEPDHSDADTAPPIELTEVPRSRPKRHPVSAQVLTGVRHLGAPLLWLGLLAFIGGTGVSAFWWLTTLPPLPSCERLQPLASDSDKLYCAEQAARSGKVEALRSGLALVKDWSPEHPLYDRSKRLMKDWSKTLLTIAQDRASQDKLDGAISLAQDIPASSPLYKDAQRAIGNWRKQHNRGQIIEDAFKAALKAQDWRTAQAQLQALSKLEGDEWHKRLNRWRQQVLIERIAHRQLQQVRQISRSGTADPQTIAQAIVIADQISFNSVLRPTAEAELKRLTKALMAIVHERIIQGNLAGAIAATQGLPRSIPLPQEARDAVWVSRAQPLAIDARPEHPPYKQLWQLWLVLPQVRDINAASVLGPQAQALVPKLEQQIQDLTQLQIALSVAELNQIPALQLATTLAEAIGRDRPQRVYAQTMIAQWRKEIQQIEDRPHLVLAQQLAKPGTVPALKAAIAQAKRVALGRALRPEAQTRIAGWMRQIQTIEDRPLLRRAQALAKQQKLQDAIQAAAKIRPGRSLYPEAQSAIGTWTAQLQIAEDRPTLDQAIALASSGNLTGAINLAYQIAPGRALYGDAQAEIDRWTRQRSAIRQDRRRDLNDDESESNETDTSERSPRSRLSPERLPPELPPP